jgi:hypothetical protein
VVRGTVVEEETGRPLAGAFVVLLDLDGNRVRGRLSDGEGGFIIQAPDSGAYRLVAELIGYRTTTSAVVSIAPGGVTELRFQVPLLPIELSGIEVSSERRCRSRPGSGLETAVLWEEARKALDVTAWVQSEAVLRLRLREFERVLDPYSLAVREERTETKQGYYGESPFVALSPEELASGGYLRSLDDGGFEYYAPDASVLLSDTFLEGHCFRVRGPPPRHPGRVGLAFEPLPGSEITDIAGVLWLDRMTGELQTLEFQYTKLPWPGIENQHIGGTVEFERMATGLWLISEWQIRMPVIRRRSASMAVSRSGTLFVGGLRQVGGEVLQARTREGQLLAVALGGTIQGMVFDSLAGAPLVGAVVEVFGTERRAVTGPDGLYRVSDLAAGTYEVGVRHPDLSLLGYRPRGRTVTVEGGYGVQVPLGVPPWSGVRSSVCPNEAGQAEEPRGIVFGLVTDDDGAPAPGASVMVLAADYPVELRTDDQGLYQLCLRGPVSGVRLVAWPRARSPWRVDIRAEREAMSRAVMGPLATEAILEGGPDRVDLRLVKRPVVSDVGGGLRLEVRETPGRDDRLMELSGRVVDGGTGRGVATANVELQDRNGQAVAHAVADESGYFHLLPRSAGSFTLSVDRIGYSAGFAPLTLSAGRGLYVDAVLAAAPIELEGLAVTARQRLASPTLGFQGFAARVERNLGEFIERDEIERRRPSTVIDLLRGKPGVRMFASGKWNREDIRFMGTERMGGRDCRPTIWVDGLLVRSAGDTIRGDPGLEGWLPSPDAIEAIELYSRPSGVPVQYNGDAMCGVIIVWTRREEIPQP